MCRAMFCICWGLGFVVLLLPSLQAQDFTINTQHTEVIGEKTFGNTLHVFADPAPTGMVFNGWRGADANLLGFPNEWQTTFTVDASAGSAFEFYPSYDSIGSTDFGSTTFPGFSESETGTFTAATKTLIYGVPPAEAVKAFVFIFHGTNGRAADWMARYDQRVILEDLVHAGYAVFAIEADEAEFGDNNADGSTRWFISPNHADTSTNVDLKNLAALERFAKGFFGAKPIFTYGGSNGANFADFSAAMLDYTGVCHMISNGNSWLYDYPGANLKPAIWIQSRNDQNGSSDSLQAKANFQKLQDRGINTAWYWLDKAPVYPRRFIRNTKAVDDGLSGQIYQRLVNRSYVLPSGLLDITRVKTDFDAESFFDQTPVTIEQQADVIHQLEFLNAEHTAHTAYSKTIIAFFDETLAQVSTDIPLQEVSWAVYPNPSSGSIQLEWPLQTAANFRLINGRGELVLEQGVNPGKQELQLLNLPTGMYTMQVWSTAGWTKSQRLFISRNQ